MQQSVVLLLTHDDLGLHAVDDAHPSPAAIVKNYDSAFYHLVTCPGVATISDKKRIVFTSEADRSVRFQARRNCGRLTLREDRP